MRRPAWAALLGAGAAAAAVFAIMSALRSGPSDRGKVRRLDARRGALEQFPPAGGACCDEALLCGAPQKKRFPALDEPRYAVPQETAWFARPEDAVLLSERDGRMYVYPEYLLAVRHVVNDAAAKEPVAVTTCEVSGNAAVYSRIVRGRAVTFTASGVFCAGNSVLYGRETETFRPQIDGLALKGAPRGASLAGSWRAGDRRRLGR